MLYGVDQKVPQDPFHPDPLHLGDARLGGQPELDLGAAALGKLLSHVGRQPGEVADIDGFRVEHRDVRVVPADLQEIGEQRLEPLQLALQQFRRPGHRACQLLPVREQHIRGDLDRCQRRAQLVRDVGHEHTLHLRQVLQRGHLFLQAGRHLVERRRERGKLVNAAHRHALVEVAGGKTLGAAGSVPDWGHHPPRNQRGDGREQEHQHDARHQQGPLDLVQALLYLRQREEVIQLVVGADGDTVDETGHQGSERGGGAHLGEREARRRLALLLQRVHLADQLGRNLAGYDAGRLARPVHRSARIAGREQDGDAVGALRLRRGLQLAHDRVHQVLGGRAVRARVHARLGVRGGQPVGDHHVPRLQFLGLQLVRGDLLHQEEAEHRDHHRRDDQRGGDHAQLQRPEPA